MTNEPIRCPKCGAEMNQHAMKIDYRKEDAAEANPTFGGALTEIHTCPHCGDIESRVIRHDQLP